MKGSVTAEAAYVVPFCFLIIGMICFLGIYQYNLAVLEMSGYECILLSMEERSGTDSDLEAAILRRAKQAGAERTIAVTQLKAELKMTESRILLSYTGVQSILKLPIEVDISYERIFPERTLRLIEELTGEAYERAVKKRIK